jgi:hypothetical protein
MRPVISENKSEYKPVLVPTIGTKSLSRAVSYLGTLHLGPNCKHHCNGNTHPIFVLSLSKHVTMSSGDFYTYGIGPVHPL